MDLLHHDIAAALIARCTPGGALGLVGIALALAGAGLVGSFAHCAPMCGPFVLMQLPAREGLVLHRATAGLLPLYHFGRATTYVALGAMLGATGQSLAERAPFQSVARLLLALAAAGFLLQALKLAFPRLRLRLSPRLGQAAGLWLARLAAAAAPASGGLLRGYRLGLVLGFLPCGFLYAALFAAAATGSAFGGATAMAGFALGTMPALATVGLLGAGAVLRWRAAAARLAAPLFLFNAAVLAAIALRGTL